jgi:hypothetical protein
MDPSTDPITRSTRRQILEGLAWGVAISFVTFRILGHSNSEILSWNFLLHLIVVTLASMGIFVAVRKWQLRLRRRLAE